MKGKNERNGIAVSYTVSLLPHNVFLLGAHISGSLFFGYGVFLLEVSLQQALERLAVTILITNQPFSHLCITSSTYSRTEFMS